MEQGRKFSNEQLTKNQVKNLQVVVCKTRLSNTIFKSNEQTRHLENQVSE